MKRSKNWAQGVKEVIEEFENRKITLDINNPKPCCQYAIEYVKGRFLEGEKVIAQDACWAYEYARNILKGRLEAGESTIAQDARWAYLYALYVFKGCWKKVKEKFSRVAE